MKDLEHRDTTRKKYQIWIGIDEAGIATYDAEALHTWPKGIKDSAAKKLREIVGLLIR
jgi:hypothetical protein